MKMRPAVELSYLGEETQRDIVDRIDETEAFPSHDQAIRIRKAYEAGEIDYDKVRDIMAEEKPNQKPKFKFSFDRLKPYIPKDYSDSKAEDYVIKALEFYQKYLKKQREQARQQNVRTRLRRFRLSRSFFRQARIIRPRFLRADFPHCRVKILVNPLGLTAFCVLHCKKSATQKIFNLKQAYF